MLVIATPVADRSQKFVLVDFSYHIPKLPVSQNVHYPSVCLKSNSQMVL